jgi:hypothetical protein
VKPFNMLKMPVILLGFAGTLLFSPASKAQEVTSDHFMEAGVLNVYEPVAKKAVQPAVKQAPAAVPAQRQKIGSISPLQHTAKRGPSLVAKPEAQAITDKQKPTPTELKKP